ncbi:DUF3604 domain-containing protein [Myxococcota bacterium]|nr:DUF3604 domain-containing protein [Myxococcota bacterium]
MRILAKIALGVALLLTCGVGALLFLSEGVTGERQERGSPAPRPIPGPAVEARTERHGQILFGDLHVHTTYSGDAFIFSLPLLQGEGAHPPADACDFARFCAELDFFSINDHAENIAPWQWSETRQAIRECNAVSGDPGNPDLVAFLGWEWTQSAPAAMPGETAPRAHYGHKNVILLDTEEGRVPSRPIGAGAGGLFEVPIPSAGWAALRAGIALSDPAHLGAYLDFNRYTRDVRAAPPCPEGVGVRDLPDDCLESAETPAALFAKLDEWGTRSLVIPHGTSWGIHAPYGSTLDPQLRPAMHDPARQRLMEVYSGHGSSEQYRELLDFVLDDSGQKQCAPPRDGYLPCCWQAGELIRERCGEVSEDVCEERVERTRQLFVEANGPMGASVVPGATPDEWLECGQFAESFLPALDFRPGMSAQYALATRDPDSGDEAGAFRFGLIASSDNHKARAGAGYKEIARKAFGDAYGLRDDWAERMLGERPARSPEPIPASEAGFFLPDPGQERMASYYYTAGLVAVHASTRDRTAIFDALDGRHAYGTSGPRILLWFDLDNGPGGSVPMGSEVFVSGGAPAPRFTVRAVGDFEQLPGCPAHSRERLSPERLRTLCLDECYHPSDVRQRIERIEIVRIRPQVTGDEAIAERIEDPWRVFECPDARAGCEVSFEDESFDGSGEILYYARAIQEPTPAVGGDPMGCRRDAQGRCLEAKLCAASGPDFDPDDDCLAPVGERAWSSPIWLRPALDPGV